MGVTEDWVVGEMASWVVAVCLISCWRTCFLSVCV